MTEYIEDQGGAVITDDCYYGGHPCDGDECQCGCHRAAELDDREPQLDDQATCHG